jgi:integrase
MTKLSVKKIEALRTPGRYPDGKGLYLQVTEALTKSWVYRYTIHGRERFMGLGPLDLVSLAEAREAAWNARKLRHSGVDPIDHRKAERAKPATVVTFKECADRLIASQEAGWRNAKHVAQWRNTLATYAFPKIGKQPVASIDTDLVLRVLEPIWTTKPETASRLRQRIQAVLDWASARGYRSKENPAQWRGHLDHLLAPQRKIATVKHHESLPFPEIASFIASLREQPGTGAKALEFLILTAARTGEVTGARWSEIDLDNKVWVIAGERMKAGREHRQPLSDPAVAILEALRVDDADGFVFGGSDGREMSNMTMTAVLRRMGRKVTVHGFRSSFKTWASEATNHPSEVVEMALAHSVGTKIEAAYRRGDLLEKRRRLMDDWAAFCAAPPRKGAEIVPIRAARMASNEIG